MEIDTCPKCGRRHFRGQLCTCMSQKAGAPVKPTRQVLPGSLRDVRTWKKPPYSFGILAVVVLVIVGILYGIGSASLKQAPSESSRSGETSAHYAQMLQDAQSAQALLNLINSRPGYDRYTIEYANALGDVDTFSYQFSTDTIAYLPSYLVGKDPLTWQGDGIKRLNREAQGGDLDD